MRLTFRHAVGLPVKVKTTEPSTCPNASCARVRLFGRREAIERVKGEGCKCEKKSERTFVVHRAVNTKWCTI